MNFVQIHEIQLNFDSEVTSVLTSCLVPDGERTIKLGIWIFHDGGVSYQIIIELVRICKIVLRMLLNIDLILHL